jgi:hypothetical protein
MRNFSDNHASCVCAWFGSKIFSFALCIYTAKLTMVIMMSEGRVAIYKVDAKADMILNNRTQIICPCQTCKLRTCKLRCWIDPDSGQLEHHLLRHGFMIGFSDGGQEDEEWPGHGHHDGGDAGGDYHHEEGDAGGHDHHEERDADRHDGDDTGVDGGDKEASTPTMLTLALQDPHVQELLLKKTSNDKAAAREKVKLAQMEYPGCRPGDTRLNVTLKALEMKEQHK